MYLSLCSTPGETLAVIDLTGDDSTDDESVIVLTDEDEGVSSTKTGLFSTLLCALYLILSRSKALGTRLVVRRRSS